MAPGVQTQDTERFLGKRYLRWRHLLSLVLGTANETLCQIVIWVCGAGQKQLLHKVCGIQLDVTDSQAVTGRRTAAITHQLYPVDMGSSLVAAGEEDEIRKAARPGI